MVFCAVIIASTGNLKAQTANSDTLLVPWLKGNDLFVNSLYHAVVGDTVAGGGRKNPNRVYKLEQGGFYYLTETIENSGFELRIVGEKGDPKDPLKNPPMIQMEHRKDGSRPEKLLIGKGAVTLKNMIINGKTTLGDLPYEIMRFEQPNVTNTFDNVTFEYAAWGIMGFYGGNSNITVTNSRFRNMVSPDQPWGGRGFSVWTSVNKIYVENNTFMNIGGFAIQLEGGVANEVWINHNTFVNNGRQVFLHGNHLNTYFTNNLIVNGFFHGEGEEGFNAVRLAEADNQFSGMFYINALPSAFGLEIQRKIVFSHNSHFREQVYENYYSSTSNVSAPRMPVRPQPVLNVRTKNFFDKYSAMVLGNLIEGSNPGLKVKPTNANQQIAFIEDLRSGKTPALWYWDPGRDNDNLSIQWPFPEDLSYTNLGHLSAAFGNLPLGDLNWFPAKKAEWMTKKDAIAQQIKALAGGNIETELVRTVESEKGNRTGSSKVVQLTDRQTIRVLASGDPSWDFTLPAAGTYDIFVKNRTWYAQNNPGRETNLIVNGTQVGVITIGKEITSALEWGEGSVKGVQLKAGANTIKLGKNWGYAEYLNIVIKNAAGETVKTIWASEVTKLDGAEFACGKVAGGEGKFCASGDAYLDITGGGYNDAVTIAEAVQYIVQVAGMVIGGGDARTSLTVNGSAAGTLNFSTSDSTFTNVASNLVNLPAGQVTLNLGSVTGKLGVDAIGIYKVKGLSTSLRDDKTLPEGFELSQNYPNPFNPTTNIQFSLPQTSNIRLSVHNLLGQTVAVLAEGTYMSGTHMIQFNASHLASGMYFYRLQTGDRFMARKMMLVK